MILSRLSPRADRPVPHLVLEGLQALAAHEAAASLEPVAQAVEPLARLSAVADPRLVRMQGQPVGCNPRRMGLMTAPWGVPVVGCQRTMSDMISWCRKRSISRSARPSLIEPSTSVISRSYGTLSKHAPGAVCPLLSLSGTAGTLLLHAEPHASSFLPPSLEAVLLPAPSAARRSLGTTKALTSAKLTLAGRSLRFTRPAVPTFRPQPRGASAGRFASRFSAGGCSRLRQT